MVAQPEAVIIGAAIADIPLQPVDQSVFDAGSTPLQDIAMRLGGDAANEAATLCRLGHRAAIVTVIGSDGAGDFVLSSLRGAEVDTRWIVRQDGLSTGINVVLVRPDGERCFITNQNGSLRRLALSDILPAVESPDFARAKIACLASMFVSPQLTPDDTAALFDRLRQRVPTLCADTTRPKRGETVSDMAEALCQLDYFFPNLSEAQALTGETAPEAVAKCLLNAGVRHVAVKLGGQGCLIADGRGLKHVPAVPDITPVDTTGAGDAFAAGFIAALLEDKPFEACAEYANRVAARCVMKVGAGIDAVP